MRWIKRFLGKQHNPVDVARALMSEFVFVDWTPEPLGLALGDDEQPRFADLALVYRGALTLLVVIAEARRNKRVQGVQVELEKHLFSGELEHSLSAVEEIKGAMTDLDHLLHPESERGELRWAASWLARGEIDEDNPAVLTLVAAAWMDAYVMLVKTVRELT